MCSLYLEVVVMKQTFKSPPDPYVEVTAFNVRLSADEALRGNGFNEATRVGSSRQN